MKTASGTREQVKTTQNKEEKMNARKVVSVVCVLVVGLALALETTPLAGPPSVEYRPGVNLIYRGAGYNVAPKVSVPVYQAAGSKLPGFYQGWTSAPSTTPKVKQAHAGLLSNTYVVPEVRVPRY
jgi:hypothetical protein